MPDNAALVERLAEAMFAYNTPAAHHFVIHDGGYEGIARAVLPIVEDHAKAEYKAGAVDALREAEGDIRAALRDLRRRRGR